MSSQEFPIDEWIERLIAGSDVEGKSVATDPDKQAERLRKESKNPRGQDTPFEFVTVAHSL